MTRSKNCKNCIRYDCKSHKLPLRFEHTTTVLNDKSLFHFLGHRGSPVDLLQTVVKMRTVVLIIVIALHLYNIDLTWANVNIIEFNLVIVDLYAVIDLYGISIPDVP